MSKGIKAFECEHCRKIYRVNGWCIKHEPKCAKNPKNIHPCYDCKFLLVDERGWMIEDEYSTATGKTKAFACSKKKVDLYSHKIDPKNIYDDQIYSNEVLKMVPLERMPNKEDGGCVDWIDVYKAEQEHWEF